MSADMVLPDSNPAFAMLHERKWNRAIKEFERRPPLAKEACLVGGFYDGQIDSTVNALHLACSLGAPAHVIEALTAIYPDGSMERDSRYSRVPLHLAVMNGAPSESVQALLKVNSKATQVPDLNQRLPLHYACKEISHGEKNAAVLVRVFPEGAKMADEQGFLPIHVACRYGVSLATIRMLIRVSPETMSQKTKKGSTAIMFARSNKGGIREEAVGIIERCLLESSNRSLLVHNEVSRQDSFHRNRKTSMAEVAPAISRDRVVGT